MHEGKVEDKGREKPQVKKGSSPSSCWNACNRVEHDMIEEDT